MKITKVEHYDSTISVLHLLYRLGLGDASVQNNFIGDYGGEWDTCGGCEEVGSDNCACDNEDNYYDYDGDYGCRCNDPDGKCYC